MRIAPVPHSAPVTDLVPRKAVANEAPSQDELVTHLRRLLASARRRWRLVASILAASILLGIIATLRAVPLYEASATMKIEDSGTDILNVREEPTSARLDDAKSMNTEMRLMDSREMAERVVRMLALDSSPAFNEAMGVKQMRANVPAAALRAERDDLDTHLLRANLGLRALKDTRLIEIRFESPSPEWAAKITNAYARAAIEADLDRGLETTKFAREFLENRIEQTKARLESSERQMIEYARRAGLVDTGSVAVPDKSGNPQLASPSLGVASLVNINSAYADARTKRIQTQALWQQASSGPIMQQPQLLQDPAVQALLSARADASAQYNTMLATRTPNHPEVIKLASKISEIDQNLARVAQRYRDSLKTNYDLAARQEAALGREIAALKSSSLDEQERNVELGILKRDVDTNRAFYDALLQRYKELSAASGSKPTSISVVDDAEVPSSPFSPNPVKNIAIALLLGGVASGVGLFIGQGFDDAVRSRDDVEQKLGFPLLGSIPKRGNSLQLERDILEKHSEIAEAYMSLQTTLNFTTTDGVPTPFLVTSSKPGEGKSTTVLATAISFLRSGKRVLLIDADLRKPSLHKVLGYKNEFGLSDVLTGQKQLKDVLNTQLEGDLQLGFVTSGSSVPDAAGLLAGTKLRSLLAHAQQLYDVVIIDGPPVIGLADAPLIAGACRGTLLVIEAGAARARETKSAAARIEQSGCPIIGCVLTKVIKSQDVDRYVFDYNYGKDEAAG